MWPAWAVSAYQSTSPAGLILPAIILIFALPAAAAEWALTFDADAVASHLEGKDLKILVVSAGNDCAEGLFCLCTSEEGCRGVCAKECAVDADCPSHSTCKDHFVPPAHTRSFCELREPQSVLCR